MEIKELEIQLNLLNNAYNSLKDWALKKDLSELERDWVIQRFEYTIELTWKTLKKFLKFEWWDDSLFPREIIKEFSKKGIIEDIKVFLDFLDLRNISSHNYNENMINDMFKFIKKNHKEFGWLIINLDKLLKRF
jgi:nucleotidyltransferase substrate binding protein (TIGR01987 family)